MSRYQRIDEHAADAGRRWPWLTGMAFAPLGDGWTCDTYAAGEDWIVQFPRDAYAAEALRRQLSLLPLLARRVPVAIPLPEPGVNTADAGPAMAYRRIRGADFREGTVSTWPEQLGRALRALHNIQFAALGLERPSLDELYRERSDQLEAFALRAFPLLEPALRSRSEALFAEILATHQPGGFGPVFVHGDLGPAHILVSAGGSLAGIIDWEDAGPGDPAADFAALLYRSPEQAERALAAYGGAPDDSFRNRCLQLFRLMPFHDVLYGQDTDQPEYVEAGLAGIRRRFAEPQSAPSTPFA